MPLGHKLFFRSKSWCDHQITSSILNPALFKPKILDKGRSFTKSARRTDGSLDLLSQLRSTLVIPGFLNSSESVSKIVNSIVFVLSHGEIKTLLGPFTDKVNGMLHIGKLITLALIAIFCSDTFFEKTEESRT